MILAIDIGNKNIAVGCSDGYKIKFAENISTSQTATVLEYAVLLKSVLEFHGIEKIEGSVISSVVPTITDTLYKAVEKIWGIKSLIVTPEIIDMKVTLENPSQIGNDLLAAAVAGINEYNPPLALINMGTAVTITVVNREREFIGGMIMPGFKISLESLIDNTSLPKIGIDSPQKLIGRNTLECMKSGIIYGSASCIDGMLERIENQIGERINAVATGSYADFIVPYCRRRVETDSELVLKGLIIIYKNNKKILP